MENHEIARLVGLLEAMRKRPLMYIGLMNVQAAECFLSGLEAAYAILSGETDPVDFREIKKQVVSERGWKATNTPMSKEMKGRGMSDEAIVDEVIDIEIETWRRVATS